MYTSGAGESIRAGLSRGTANIREGFWRFVESRNLRPASMSDAALSVSKESSGEASAEEERAHLTVPLGQPVHSI
ncbi:hypothetical protein N9V90_01550 [Endozoicomonas sp.]|nr:hypothetical protein [Endozoicomonas sp.]